MMKDSRSKKIAAKLVVVLGSSIIISIINWYPLVIRTPPRLPLKTTVLVIMMMMTMVSSRNFCRQAKWIREIKHEHRPHRIFWPIKLL